MNTTLSYNDVFVRMPLGCDISKLIAFVKSMGGMAITSPDVRIEEERDAASVDAVYGIWSDEDYPSADEMCNFLKESRTCATARDEKLNTAWQ